MFLYVGHTYESSIAYNRKGTAKFVGKNVTCGTKHFCPPLGLAHSTVLNIITGKFDNTV